MYQTFTNRTVFALFRVEQSEFMEFSEVSVVAFLHASLKLNAKFEGTNKLSISRCS